MHRRALPSCSILSASKFTAPFWYGNTYHVRSATLRRLAGVGAGLDEFGRSSRRRVWGHTSGVDKAEEVTRAADGLLHEAGAAYTGQGVWDVGDAVNVVEMVHNKGWGSERLRGKRQPDQ